jgi:uncharacterized membrane protein YfcA
MLLTLFAVSLIGGFCSGFLGVGGAVVLIPLLLSVPPLVGVGQLDMSEVSGLTMIQVLASSIVGFLVHRRGGFAHIRTILSIGIPMGVCSFAGAAVSRYMSGETMLLIFGCLVAISFGLLMKKASDEGDEERTEFTFNPYLSVLVGAIIGFVAGVVGAGGGFVLIPVMVRVLKIPMKVGVGSSLGIVFFGALMGAAGKMLTLQVEWLYLLPVIAGCIPAAFVGAQVSKRLPVRYVRYTLVSLISVILVKTWWDILAG